MHQDMVIFFAKSEIPRKNSEWVQGPRHRARCVPRRLRSLRARRLHPAYAHTRRRGICAAFQRTSARSHRTRSLRSPAPPSTSPGPKPPLVGNGGSCHTLAHPVRLRRSRSNTRQGCSSGSGGRDRRPQRCTRACSQSLEDGWFASQARSES